ncbi:MAG: replicative DNA helicase [Defluviitaleaceae bacterium]|nr:replicative DNA helicase [Defluviitaleaceae bacterium]
MEPNQTRALPHDIEAEQAILGCMFFGEEASDYAVENMRGSYFHSAAHRTIFETMVELTRERIGIDIVTVKASLDKKNVTEAVGGREYLINIASSVSTAANLSQYIKIVENKAILRKLINTSNGISSMSYEEKESIETIVEYAEKEIFNIISGRSSEDFAHIKEIMEVAVERIEELSNQNSKITGIETGFIDFDEKTAGLQNGDFILIAARPSMGKTAFALNIAQYSATKKKIPVAVFSLEMSKEQLVTRMLSSEAMLDSQKLRTGDLKGEDWERIAHGVHILANSPIYINDTPGITVSQIRAKSRKLKLEKGLGLILIDYLQLMSGSAGPTNNRQQEISEISRSLKGLARELNVPVVALSQLSRAVEARGDKRPMLSDLRESGAIEQDADVVSFLYRDEYYNPETETPNTAELIIAKQRNGPTGTVNLAWLSKHTKFANISH